MKTLIQFFLRKLVSSDRVRNYLETQCKVGQGMARSAPYQTIGVVPLQIGERELRVFPFGDLTSWRYETLYTKEPETLEWIDELSEDTVLWDIGANIGLYSLYAAARKPGCTILAFEPEPSNYFVLYRNLDLNNLFSRVHSFPLAFSLKSEIGTFFLSDSQPGAALHSLGSENTHAPDPSSRNTSMLCMSVDDFIHRYNPPFPNAIKIDVDGVERDILEGAGNTLRDPRMRSVSIEIDESDDPSAQIVQLLEAAGFDLHARRHSAMFDHGDFRYTYNCIFRKAER